MKNNKPNAVKERPSYNETAILRDFVVIFLFFAGMALIAVGLWYIWPPLAMVFTGVACLYLARCVSLTAKSPERTVKK